MIFIIQKLVTIALILFDGGIAVRIMLILINGQQEENQNTKQKVINHIKAAIIVNLLPALVFILAQYYQ